MAETKIDFIDKIKGELKSKSPLYIKVKVIPKSPKTELVEQMEDGTYKVRVHAAPVKGAANEELCKFLRKILGVNEVVVVSGGRDRIKLIRISI